MGQLRTHAPQHAASLSQRAYELNRGVAEGEAAGPALGRYVVSFVKMVGQGSGRGL
jgi:hypothetical protein